MFGLEWILIITGLSLILLIAWMIVTSVEATRSSRLFASRFRNFLDSTFEQMIARLARWYVSITRHKIKLSWYYSIHAILVAMMAFLATIYHKIESVLISNRAKAKKIRKEKHSLAKSHLTEIAEHKESTQLSPKEKTRRKNESLKGW